MNLLFDKMMPKVLFFNVCVLIRILRRSLQTLTKINNPHRHFLEKHICSPITPLVPLLKIPPAVLILHKDNQIIYRGDHFSINYILVVVQDIKLRKIILGVDIMDNTCHMLRHNNQDILSYCLLLHLRKKKRKNLQHLAKVYLKVDSVFFLLKECLILLQFLLTQVYLSLRFHR